MVVSRTTSSCMLLEAVIMTHEQKQNDTSSEQVVVWSQEIFLKELYTYMKKRDIPIERIPHLGFKQIDLFMMYKTVKNLGGYHQVTAQQMWKQVYNTLGGNPKSTSAATCTRRHYEKLLLPFECHISGGDDRDALPQRQQKRLHSSEKDDCPRPAKYSMPPPQQSHHTFLPDSRVRVVPLPVPFYPHPAFPIETQYLHPPPAYSLQPGQPPYLTFTPGQMDIEKQPLERLRFLADRYKDTSGWTEPLNLSKRPGLESKVPPPSSFAPPPSNKSPKFLNTPFPLYPVKGPAKDEGCESGDGESSPGKPHLYHVTHRDDYVIDLTSSSGGFSYSPTPASSTHIKTGSPVLSPLQSSKASGPAVANAPKPPKREYPDWSTGVMRGESPKNSPEPLNLSSNLLSPPTETGGRMEIQIPLALLHDLIKGGLLCGPAGSRHGALSMQRPTLPGPVLGLTKRSEVREKGPTWFDITSSMANHAEQVLHSHYRHLDRDSVSLDGPSNLSRLLSGPYGAFPVLQPQASSIRGHPL
ncbi:hypothetical protein DPEC_G00324330 [Dallia pectoralis]|uniref:Uncharacterized protein n=1 Tax=Dallia pectoralis TaxID=75939 RepID=A0ACC2FAU4_DALPE|nr:hypothetical protein DPEC_G00324330 [Dallia pectoralis]